MTEAWLPVVGWEEFYEVSDLGRVRSLPRRVRTGYGWRTLGGNVVVLCSSGEGQRRVQMNLSAHGVKKTRRVHQLVMEAFVGPCPDGMEVRHLDGDDGNNVLTNLAYGTHQENEADKISHGTIVRGNRHVNAVLCEYHARIIYGLKGVIPRSKLAKAFGVTVTVIRGIHLGHRWRHATAEMDAYL